MKASWDVEGLRLRALATEYISRLVSVLSIWRPEAIYKIPEAIYEIPEAIYKSQKLLINSRSYL